MLGGGRVEFLFENTGEALDIRPIKLKELKPGIRLGSRFNDVDSLIRSIHQFGQLTPIIVDKQQIIIDGHRRVEVLRRIGADRAIARVYDGPFTYQDLFTELNETRLEGAQFEMKRLEGEEYERLKASIEKYGLIQPILVDWNYKVVDGHRRMMACAELGWYIKESQVAFLKENGHIVNVSA